MFLENLKISSFHFVCVGLYRRIRTWLFPTVEPAGCCYAAVIINGIYCISCICPQPIINNITHSTAQGPKAQSDQIQSSFGVKRWPRFFKKIGLSSHRVWWAGILCMWRRAAFIFCPFINPVYIPAAFHPSIHPSVHRAFLAHASVMTSAELVLVYRHLKETSLTLQFIIYHLFFTSHRDAPWWVKKSAALLLSSWPIIIIHRKVNNSVSSWLVLTVNSKFHNSDKEGQG